MLPAFRRVVILRRPDVTPPPGGGGMLTLDAVFCPPDLLDLHSLSKSWG